MNNIIGKIEVVKIEHYDENEIINDFKENIIIKINDEKIDSQKDYKISNNFNKINDNDNVKNVDNIQKNIEIDQVDPNDFFNSGYKNIENIILNKI